MWPAVFVHIFTASGAVCGLMATLAVFERSWETVFAWLGVALVIDGVDGALARMAKVERHLPRFSGQTLDHVIDYVTYVFVPVLALLQAGFLAGSMGLVLASMVLLSALFHFSDTASKAEDNSFVGFPAIWNAVAFYVFTLGLSTWATAVFVLVCVALTFVPLKWAHPLRTPAFRPVTVAAVVLWGIAAGSALLSGFPAGSWEKAILVLTGVYAVALTLWSGRGTFRP